MIKTIKILLISAIIFVSHSHNVVAEPEKTYSFGIVPQFEAKKLRRIWIPILKQLELKTGFKFKLIGAPTIPAFEDEFLAGKFDFSYMNPFHLLIANESQGYIPLLRDHNKKLQGVLVVRKDSGISSVKDLNNKLLAFPSPNALGASLLMRAELHDKFKLNITPMYVKTHDSVYLNVLLQQAEGGCGIEKTFNKQNVKLRDKMKIIYKTTPVSPHPISVHPRVPEQDRKIILNAMIDLANSASGKKMLARIPINNLGKASMKDYKPLDEMKLKRFYISE